MEVGPASDSLSISDSSEASTNPVPDGYVVVSPGTFKMGSPYGLFVPESEPCRYADEYPHQVSLSRSFLMKQTEVTQAEWVEVMGYNPSSNPECDACPVETVTRLEALEYTIALSEAEGLQPCYSITCPESEGPCAIWLFGDIYACEGYRLPTEAEWEYAARAGISTATYNGDIAEADCDATSSLPEPIAWYAQNSGETTHAVAQKDPNPWGLYDMLGNVQEWTWDDYADYESFVTDPLGVGGGLSTARGCADRDLPRDCRAATRFKYCEGCSASSLGFRLVKTLFE